VELTFAENSAKDDAPHGGELRQAAGAAASLADRPAPPSRSR
jgi:hypothetical protein